MTKVRNWFVIRKNLKRLVILCSFKGMHYEKIGEQEKAFACYFNAQKFQELSDKAEKIAKKRGE